MRAKNKFVCLIAMLLAAFALPASAATKSISLTVPASLSGSASVQHVPVSINNTGNSNANSFEIDWSVSPSFVVASCQIGSGTPVTPKAGLTGTGYKGCTFLSQAPNKSSVTVTLNVVVTAACGASSLTWNAFAWTGAPGPASQSFDIAALGTYTTPLPVATNCTLGFATQPTDAFIGFTITGTPFNSTALNKVRVLAQQGSPSAPSPGVSVSVNSSSTAACSITGTATTDANGYATFTTLKSTAAASFQGCQLTASSSGYLSANSATFNIVLKDGDLTCASTGAADAPVVGNLDPLSNNAFTGDADSGLVRGLNSNDGTCGAKVPYAFSYDSANKTVKLIEDSLGQNPSVEYVILWEPVDIDSDGWAGKQPCVSWGITPPLNWVDDPVYGCAKTSDYVPALVCLSDNVDGGPAVMPDIPSVEPYINNPHSQFQPTSVTGQKAKVCVAQHGMTPASGQVQYWTKFIDQSDSGIRLP